MDLKHQILNFINDLSGLPDYELLNEASLQNDLASKLRSQFKTVQLERNILLDYPNKTFTKKKMDIFLVSKKDSDRFCIEIKFPPGKSVELLHTYEDIAFCTELKIIAGFKAVFCVFIVAHETYKNKFGEIINQSKIKDNRYLKEGKLQLNGSFDIDWNSAFFLNPNISKNEKTKHWYFVIEI